MVRSYRIRRRRFHLWFFHQDLATERDWWGGSARHGRGSVNLYSVGPVERSFVEVAGEWLFLDGRRRSGGLSLGVSDDPSGDHDWTFHVGLGRLASLWFHISGPWLPHPDREPRYSPRKLGFDCHNGSIFWTVWKDPNSWSRDDGWRNRSWNWMDFLFGVTQRTTEVVAVEESEVPMPERNYPVRVTLERAVSRRPRGIFGIGYRVHYSADVTPLPIPEQVAVGIKGPHIPYPGKNGGDDGLYGMSCPARTTADAVGHVVQSVLQSRARRGGAAWLPSYLRS